MARGAVFVACALGWLILVAGILAPLAGVAVALGDARRISTVELSTPTPLRLLADTTMLSSLATAAGLLLSLPAGGLLGEAGRRHPELLGVILSPLLIPPQIYAYAWNLLPGAGPRGGPASVVVSGLITAGWLWPAAAVIIAAGWRTAGRQAWTLALLDAGPFHALLRAALPAMRPYLAAAAGTLFAVATIEYSIPHLMLARVHSTELMLLVDAGAPAGQVARLAAGPLVLTLAAAGLAAAGLRGVRSWQAIEDADNADETKAGASPPASGFAAFCGPGMWAGTTGVLALTVAAPAILMVLNWRDPSAWIEAFRLFASQWLSSALVAAGSGAMSAAVATAVVLWGIAGARGRAGLAAGLPLLSALVPPAALGMGMVVVYNGLSGLDRICPRLPGAAAIAGLFDGLYSRSPVVWMLALTGRFAAVAVLATWLAAGRRSVAAVEQARADGAGRWAVLAHVLWPMHAPVLLAGGLVVAVLALSEVVATHLVGPAAFPSIALTLLNHMHYGRDDVVIATSLTMVAGAVATMSVCARLPAGRG